MHTFYNIVQKQRQCIVGAQETHSFRGIVVKKAKIHSAVGSVYFVHQLNSSRFYYCSFLFTAIWGFGHIAEYLKIDITDHSEISDIVGS